MEKCFLNLVPPYFSFLSILEKKRAIRNQSIYHVPMEPYLSQNNKL